MEEFIKKLKIEIVIEKCLLNVLVRNYPELKGIDLTKCVYVLTLSPGQRTTQPRSETEINFIMRRVMAL
jgi:hypothetical protein